MRLYPLGVGFAIVRSPSPSGANPTFGASWPAGGVSLVSVASLLSYGGMKKEAVRRRRTLSRGGPEMADYKSRCDRLGRGFTGPEAAPLEKAGCGGVQ